MQTWFFVAQKVAKLIMVERVGVGVQNAVNHLGSSHHQADFGAFEGDVSHASKPTYEDIWGIGGCWVGLADKMWTCVSTCVTWRRVCRDRCDDGQMSPSNLQLQPGCAIFTWPKSNTFLVCLTMNGYGVIALLVHRIHPKPTSPIDHQFTLPLDVN